MRQHFKVTHSHALNDEEIPKQDRRKSKWQCGDERVCNTETTKHMIKLMIMKTMIAGQNTISL
jgi:hypothetical protein